MTEKTYPPTSEFSKNAHVNAQEYAKMYDASVKDPDAFWSEHGKRVDWIKPFSIVKNVTYADPDVSIKWFEDGTLNVAANCVDRSALAPYNHGNPVSNQVSNQSSNAQQAVKATRSSIGSPRFARA